MSRDLNVLPPCPPIPKGFRIEQLNAPPELQPLTTERRRRHHQGLIAMLQLQPRQLWCFTASRGKQHVGRAILLAAAGVAGIYGVEVLKDFRRRGLGAALVYAALREAQSLGFRSAVLSASGLGQGIYERLGFREICRLSFWKFGKMRQLKS
jgi:ribosomal protein S18 acetylase RimI-like enzyme